MIKLREMINNLNSRCRYLEEKIKSLDEQLAIHKIEMFDIKIDVWSQVVLCPANTPFTREEVLRLLYNTPAISKSYPWTGTMLKQGWTLMKGGELWQ